MKHKLILSLILAFLVSIVNAQVVKVGESQIAEQLCNQGVVLLESGDLQGAITKFNDAIQLKSDFAKAYAIDLVLFINISSIINDLDNKDYVESTQADLQVDE